MKANLLIVDDDPLIIDLIADTVNGDRYQVFRAETARAALEIFESESIDLALLDYSLPDLCGADLYRQMRAGNPALPVIFLTGHPNLETAVKLMKDGVRDYLTKPFSLKQLVSHIDAILQASRGGVVARARPQTRPAATGRAPSGYILGSSEAMRNVEAQVVNLPRYPDTTVLITGPTGTGKSAVARRIHELTWGNSAPFVEIDCSTIPRELCESELFGHEKGSFTGAHRTKMGLFEAAGHGTAFLDEIGELDAPLQAKFLHVLEARQFKRVGGHATLPMAARVIAATNRCLPDLVRQGRFREDLYFRLNVFELWMPPLKERGSDVPVLAQNFLEYFAAHHHKTVTRFSPEALSFLHSCDFPGNVRELRNMVERAVISTHTPVIEFPHLVMLRQRVTLPEIAPLPPCVNTQDPPETQKPARRDPDGDTMHLPTLERQKLLEALTAADGNKSKAAKLVGLSRTAFYRRLVKHQTSFIDGDPGIEMDLAENFSFKHFPEPTDLREQ